MDLKFSIFILFQILAISLVTGQTRRILPITPIRLTTIRPTQPPVVVPAFTNCTQFSTSNDFWVMYPGSQYCYHYASVLDKKAAYSGTWQNAVDICRRKGSNLVSIHDFRTNYILSNPVSMKNSYSGFYWIGLSSLNGTRGVYKWSDGTPRQYIGNISATTPSGAKVDPNPLNQGRCMAFYLAAQDNPSYKTYKAKGILGVWYKTACNERLYYICKRSIAPRVTTVTPPPKPTPGGCPTGWYKFAGQKCIKYVATPVIYSQARATCQKINGDLLSIHSPSESDLITTITYGLASPFIGLNRPNLNFAMKWADGSAFTYSNYGIMTTYSSKLNCVTIVTNKTQPGKWMLDDCNRKHAVLCEINQQDPKISTGLTLNSNKCKLAGFANYIQYRKSCYHIVETPVASFSTAEDNCKSAGNGAHLISIVDTVEESFLRYYLSQNGKNDKYWIGLQSKVVQSSDGNPLNTSQVFEWTDNWPMYYSNWAPLEPKVPKAVQDQCVFFEKATGLWITRSCDSSLPFICKVSSVKAPNFDNIDKSGYCPTLQGNTDSSLAWVNLHKGTPYCYWFSTERSGLRGTTGYMSYSDSSFQCRRRNGTLVSIHSQHVMSLILNRLKNRIPYVISWIGLSRNPSGNYCQFLYFDLTFGELLGEFNWDDNSAIDFTNGLPLDELGNTTNLNDDSTILCAELKYDGTWEWTSCLSSERHYYVCQTSKLYNPSDESHAGRTAGIVIGVLIGIAALVALGVYVRRSNMKMPQMPSFNNPLRQSQRTQRFEDRNDLTNTANDNQFPKE